ncbi:MAG: DNA-processing protein DprA [Myxococcota bacterium]
MNRSARERYSPPETVEEMTLGELLRRSGRKAGKTEQLELLGTRGRDLVSQRMFAAGDTELLDRPCVAIVGTRKVSNEGASRARRLARELAAQDVVVVSGLAKGVDTAALHSAVISGGRTVGVLGTPLDRATPVSNSELQMSMYRDHLLLSQFAAGSVIQKNNFPRRNRTMAAISDATVIIEASDTSGTLHQAVECSRLGRWLFIARSLVENTAVSWPRQFLNYPTTVVLGDTDDVLERLESCPSA